MNVILSVDVGGSTTKIVGFQGRQLLGTLQVRATDQLTSLFGAIGHFLRQYELTLSQVKEIVLTGVGASLIHEDIYGILTRKVPEFQAIGYGGLYLSGLSQALVVSMGTGTAYVRATEEGIRHIGGSGVGGGTLLGLSSKLLKENDMAMLAAMAEQGDLSRVDLAVQDISYETVASLPPGLTASNFGKIKNVATSSDIALGLVNMVFQTVGMLAVFACLHDTVRDVVLTGTLTTLPQVGPIFDELSKLHGIRFVVPPQAVFATAIGAAVPFLEGERV